ncbi:MAG: DUF6383 domain-containing protein [Bacteroidales bacterium]
MKRNLLFVTMATCMSLSTVNAENVTPSNFLFKNLPIGKFQITNAGSGANPNVDLDTPGDVVIACGPGAADKLIPVVKNCACIVGSKWGNLLMVKGQDSSVEEGIATPGSLNTGWWSINFIGPKSIASQKYRGTVQIKVVADVADESKLIDVNYVTGGGNNQSLPGQARDVLAFGDTGWYQAQLEGTVGTTDPARFRVQIPGGAMDKSALYIYEVRFEKNPTEPIYNSPNDGTPGSDAPIGAVETSLNDFANHKGAFVTWEKGMIYINEAAGKSVVVYTVSGQKVKEFTAGSDFESLTLASGIYLVCVDGQTTKVAL